MKVYAVGYKQANGEKQVWAGASRFWFKTRAEAIQRLRESQYRARREIERKKCEPIACGSFGIECEYIPELTDVEFFIYEAEKPVWKKIDCFTLDDEIK